MKPIIYLWIPLALVTACQHPVNKEAIKKEIFEAEKAFERMAAEKGIAEAFASFAADDAVIKRENDTLIVGRDDIRRYYEKGNPNAMVNWTPDFIDVSDDGTLGYTYGKYLWKIKNEAGEISEYKGRFHTVWKKQPDNTWKYVWD